MEDVKFRKYPCKEVATNMAQVETWVVLEKKQDIQLRPNDQRRVGNQQFGQKLGGQGWQNNQND